MEINKAEIRRKAQICSRAQMMEYAKKHLGASKLTEKDFETFLRATLPPESAYQSAIVEWIRKNYPTAFCWKAAAGPYSRGGIPDLCVILNGQFYGFEVKRPFLGHLTKLQDETLRQIRRAGGHTAVVSFPAQVAEVLGHER